MGYLFIYSSILRAGLQYNRKDFLAREEMGYEVILAEDTFSYDGSVLKLLMLLISWKYFFLNQSYSYFMSVTQH